MILLSARHSLNSDMPFLRRHWPVLTLVLLPLVVLWRCVFLGETIGPWDQIMQMAPWGGPKPTSAWDVLQADGVLQFYPWRDLVFEAWGKGQLPLWNPYQLCGTPLLANSQSAGFYPLHILMGVLQVPTSLAVTLLAWFHLAWASLGARFLARQYGANEYGAVIAGACFGLSAFMVSWTPLASVVTTCSWIPWVIGLGKALVAGAPPLPEAMIVREDEERVAGGDPERPRPSGGEGIGGEGQEAGSAGWKPAPQTMVVLLALACAMMLLGGHLQFAAYGFIGLVVIALVEGIKARAKWPRWVGLAGAVVLGGMLAAPQILPVLAFSKESHRQVKPTAEGAAAYAASAIGLPELTGFAFPSATGLPGKAVTPDGLSEPVPSYWPAYVKRGAAFAEGAIGLGPIVIGLLAFLNRRKLREALGMSSLSLTGLLLALGPLSALFYLFFPGWSGTGSPGRAIVLVVLSLCCLAGTALPKEFNSNAVKRLLWILLGSAALTLGLSTMAAGMKPWLPGVDSVSQVIIAAQVSPVSWMQVAAITLTAIALLKYQPRISAGLVTVCFLLAGPLFCLPSGKPVPTIKPPAPTTRAAFVNSNWGLLQAAPAIMPGNTATTARIHDVAGYDSLLSKDTLEMLRSVNGGKDPAPDANGNMMFVKPGFDPAKLADAGVSEVWSLQPLPQLPTEPEQRGNVLVYELTGPGRAFVAQSPSTASLGTPAEMTVDGTDRQTIKATGPGTLVVKDRNLPGWTVTVDGKPAEIKPGLWRQLDLPEGPHTVDFHYSPPGLINGFFAAIVGALTTCCLLVFGRAKPVRAT